jgi:hypothetical protein
MPTSIQPTFEDATLILRLYELRREEKLRAAREWFRTKFFPMTFDDVRTIIQAPGEENAYYRMVTTYWEMACSLVTSGVLHPDLFLQSGGEVLLVWSRLEEYVPRVREESPWFLVNVEKAIAMVPWSQDRLKMFRARLATTREKMLKTQKSFRMDEPKGGA